MVGIVVVSHSPRLAQAALDLALEMVVGEKPPIAIAAGTLDGATGTDATKIAEAITTVLSPRGVLVLMDLGSAVLSAGLALEFLDDDRAEVRLSSAPFLEGLQAAVVRAAGGASLDEVEREAAGSLAAKQSQLGDDLPNRESVTSPSVTGMAAAGMAATSTAGADNETADATVDIVLVNLDGLHARPAAAVVAAVSAFDARVTVINLRSGAGPSSANSPTALASLAARTGDTVRVAARGPDAAAAVAALGTLMARGFGERLSGEPAREPARPAASASLPLGVSPGRVAGSILVMPPPIPEPAAAPILAEGDRSAEAERARAAAAEVAAALTMLAKLVSSSARDVITATAAIALDPELLASIHSRIMSDGLRAERAVWDAVADIADVFAKGGALLAARIVDLHNVRDRIIAKLIGRPVPGIPESRTPYVLVATDLAPTDTAVLDPSVCLAIVTEDGGPTSHTAILARSLGIPAVVAAHGITAVAEGTMLLVDGTTGEIVIDPTDEQLVTLTPPGEIVIDREPGTTADGHQVVLLANIASADSVAEALEAGAEGVGLFRTEFCFLGRTEAPSIDEQVMA